MNPGGSFFGLANHVVVKKFLGTEIETFFRLDRLPRYFIQERLRRVAV